MSYGQGRGFGFRGSAPAWPYTGRGRGGQPRCAAPGLRQGFPRGTPVRGELDAGELGRLKGRAATLGSELDAIEKRISELEKS